MRYLLDTTVLIDHASGWPGAVALVRRLFSEPNDLLACDAVVTEALPAGRRRDRGRHAMIVRSSMSSTHPDAASGPELPDAASAETSPRRLGDAIIAGVAWHQDAIVVTRNPADFEIQGVRVLGYE